MKDDSPESGGALLICGGIAESRRAAAISLARILTHSKKEEHPDILIVSPEGKSRTIGIGEVREITRKVSLKAAIGKWKVVVIHEADRLTAQASNALLKTLEEPTEATRIILTARTRGDLLPTIASRCTTRPIASVYVEYKERCEVADIFFNLLEAKEESAVAKAVVFSARLAALIEKLASEEKNEESRAGVARHYQQRVLEALGVILSRMAIICDLPLAYYAPALKAVKKARVALGKGANRPLILLSMALSMMDIPPEYLQKTKKRRDELVS